MLPKPTSYLHLSNGYTTQAIITNLTNLGVKFETPQQAGFRKPGLTTAISISTRA